MKILHVTDSGGMHGKEMVIKNLIAEHSKKHTVHFMNLYENDEVLQCMRAAGADLCVHTKSSLLTTRQCILNLIHSFKENYDVIHTHDSKSGVLVNSLKVFNKLPTIIRTLHGFCSVPGDKRHKLKLIEALDRTMLRFNDNTVSVSNSLKHLANDIISNGIEISHLKDIKLNSKITDFCSEYYTIGCIGRLSVEKNHSGLIEAFSLLPDVTPLGNQTRLVIFGDGPLMSNLQDQINRLPSDVKSRIMLAGNVKNAGAYIPHLCMYVQPSFTEGMPITVLEAMSQEVPVAGSSVGDMKVLIDDKSIYEISIQPEHMAQNLQDYIKSPLIRINHVHQGLISFNRKYTAYIMSKSYMNLYKPMK